MENNLKNTPQTQIATNESLSDLSGELCGFICDYCKKELKVNDIVVVIKPRNQGISTDEFGRKSYHHEKCYTGRFKSK